MKNKGFTLVEVLVATIILIIAIIGTSAFFYANRRNLVNARLKRQATWAAVEKMEELKGLSYSSLSEGASADTVILGDTVADRTATIDEDLEEDMDYKEITVNVNWGTGEVELATYVSD